MINIDQLKSDSHEHHNLALNILLPVTLLQPLLGVKRNTRHHKPDFWMQIKTVLRKSVDFKLLHNPIYIVFCVSSVLYRFSSSAPVLFLLDRAVSSGHSTKTAALLLTVFGGTTIVERISHGVTADIPKVRGYCTYLYISAFLVCGRVSVVNIGE